MKITLYTSFGEVEGGSDISHSQYLNGSIAVHVCLQHILLASTRSQLSNARSLMPRKCLDRFLMYFLSPQENFKISIFGGFNFFDPRSENMLDTQILEEGTKFKRPNCKIKKCPIVKQKNGPWVLISSPCNSKGLRKYCFLAPLDRNNPKNIPPSNGTFWSSLFNRRTHRILKLSTP